MNNFLNIFDNNNQLNDEDSMNSPRVSFELSSNLTPVAGHIGLSYRGCLLVWGGYFYSENQLGYRDPDVLYVFPHALTGNSNVWLKIKCTCKVLIKPNCGASGLIYKDDLYIFGGTTTVNESFARTRSLPASTLYKLDLKSGIFTFVSIADNNKIPTPRDKSASWVVGDKLYYFGGYGIRLSRLENVEETYLFMDGDYKEGNDVGRNVWNNQLLEFDISKNIWSLIPKSGNVPSQRAAPGAAYVSDLHSVFLFGGRDESSRLNDLYRLDMYSKHWTKIEVEGNKPIGRSWSSFTFLPDKKLIVMQGGFSNNDCPLDDVWHLDLSEYYDIEKCRLKSACAKWICIREMTPVINHDNGNEEVIIEDISPYRRFWHTANLVSDEAILSYGGMNQNPCITGPCLNTLLVQQIQPKNLFNTCLLNLQQDHLPKLPTIFSTLNLKRKMNLLEELHRFKKRKNSSYLVETDRHCPSLYELSLAEIFDILDQNVY